MKNLIGKDCIIKDIKHQPNVMVGGRYIDDGRRIRLTTGEYSGEVLIGSDFELVELISQGEAPAILASVWSL